MVFRSSWVGPAPITLTSPWSSAADWSKGVRIDDVRRTTRGAGERLRPRPRERVRRHPLHHPESLHRRRAGATAAQAVGAHHRGRSAAVASGLRPLHPRPHRRTPSRALREGRAPLDPAPARRGLVRAHHPDHRAGGSPARPGQPDLGLAVGLPEGLRGALGHRDLRRPPAHRERGRLPASGSGHGRGADRARWDTARPLRLDRASSRGGPRRVAIRHRDGGPRRGDDHSRARRHPRHLDAGDGRARANQDAGPGHPGPRPRIRDRARQAGRGARGPARERATDRQGRGRGDRRELRGASHADQPRRRAATEPQLMRLRAFGPLLTVSLALTPFLGDTHAPARGGSRALAVTVAHAGDKETVSGAQTGSDAGPVPPELAALSSTPATVSPTPRLASSTSPVASTAPPMASSAPPAASTTQAAVSTTRWEPPTTPVAAPATRSTASAARSRASATRVTGSAPRAK